jgi:hypothetical protein
MSATNAAGAFAPNPQARTLSVLVPLSYGSEKLRIEREIQRRLGGGVEGSEIACVVARVTSSASTNAASQHDRSCRLCVVAQLSALR